MMPRLDGLGLVAALRADSRTAAVPVLLLSARAGQEASIEGLQAGADDYLVKPFSAMELLARVRSNLEMARFRNRESQFRRALIDSLQEGFFLTDTKAPSWRPIRPSWPWSATARTACRSAGRTPGFRTPRRPRGVGADDQAFADYQRHGGGRYTVPVRYRDGHAVWLACSSASLPSPRRARPAVRRHRAGRDIGTAGRAARGHPGRLRRRAGRRGGDIRDADYGRPRDRRRGTRQPGDHRAMVQQRQPRHHRMAPAPPRARAPPPR